MIFKILNIYAVLTFGLGLSYDDTRLYEGSKCENLNSFGICTRQPDCYQAVEEIEIYGYHNLARCGFNKFVEIVCCPTLTNKIKVRKSIQVCEDYQKELPKFTRHSPTVGFVPISVPMDVPKSSPYPIRPIVAFGDDVDVDEYPHVVALGFYNHMDKVYAFVCGGTLISNKYVITAAHCIANIDGNKLEVIRIGTLVVPTDPVLTLDETLDYKVKNVTLYPKYNRRAHAHDIALVELEHEVKFQSNVRPACLYTEDEAPSQMQVAGWGAINITGERSKILQKANVSAIPIQRCAQRFGSNRRHIGSTISICAQDIKSDTCEGDSGGPLQVESNRIFTLVGVTSFGFACFGGLPGVYTKVFSYLDWIEEIVWS